MGPRSVLVPAAHVYLLRADEVLLQQRDGTGYMDGHWVASAAGHIEAGEHAAATAIREAREEIGVHVEQDDLLPLTVLQRTDGTDDPVQQRVDWYFVGRRWRGAPRIMEPAKCSGLRWWPIDALPTPIPDYEAVVLRGLLSGESPRFTTFGFAT